MKFWLWISSSRSVAQVLQLCAAAEVGEPTAHVGEIPVGVMKLAAPLQAIE